MSGGGHTKFRANLAVQSAPKSSRKLGIPVRDDALLHAVEAVYTVMIDICDLRGSSSGGKRKEAHHLAEHIRHCEAGVDDLSLVRNGWEAQDEIERRPRPWTLRNSVRVQEAEGGGGGALPTSTLLARPAVIEDI